MLNNWLIDWEHKALLTNMRSELRGLIEEAIENTGRHDLYCRDDPVGPYANSMIGSHFSLWHRDNRDCSDFWAEVDRLKQLPHWKIYLALVE